MNISRNLIIVVTLIILLSGFLIALTAQTTYRYGTSAQEQPVVSQTQRSVSIVQVPVDELPVCVRSISYLPKSAVSTCFIQIECAGEPKPQEGEPLCEKVDETGLSCAYPTESCIQLTGLSEEAASKCGC